MTQRLQVDGGWCVRTWSRDWQGFTVAMAMCFVPDYRLAPVLEYVSASTATEGPQRVKRAAPSEA